MLWDPAGLGENDVLIPISLSERGKFASLPESGNYFAFVLLTHSDPAQHLDEASSGAGSFQSDFNVIKMFADLQ